MKTKLAVKVCIVAVLFVTAGCVGGDIEGMNGGINVDAEPAETNESGGEILETSLEAAEETETYRTDAESRIVVSGSSLFGLSVPVDSEGAFDHDTNLAHVESEGTVEVEAFGVFENETDYETEVYVTENQTHTRKTEDSETTTGGWMTTPNGMNETAASMSLEDTASVLEDADAELEGEETVNGNDAYVLSLGVSPEAVGEHTERLTDTYGPDELGDEDDDDDPDEDEEIPDEAVEEFDTYLWVDQDTRQPLRFAYYLSMGFEDVENGGDDDGFLDIDGNAEFFSDIEYTDHGEPVDIQLPDEVGG